MQRFLTSCCWAGKIACCLQTQLCAHWLATASAGHSCRPLQRALACNKASIWGRWLIAKQEHQPYTGQCWTLENQMIHIWNTHEKLWCRKLLVLEPGQRPWWVAMDACVDWSFSICRTSGGSSPASRTARTAPTQPARTSRLSSAADMGEALHTFRESLTHVTGQEHATGMYMGLHATTTCTAMSRHGQ